MEGIGGAREITLVWRRKQMNNLSSAGVMARARAKVKVRSRANVKLKATIRTPLGTSVRQRAKSWSKGMRASRNPSKAQNACESECKN